jgi:hypothetical protein
MGIKVTESGSSGGGAGPGVYPYASQRLPLPDGNDQLVYLPSYAVGATSLANTGALGAGPSNQYNLAISGTVPGLTGFYADMAGFVASTDALNSPTLADPIGTALDASIFTLEIVLFLFQYDATYTDLFGIQWNSNSWSQGSFSSIGIGLVNIGGNNATWGIRGDQSGINSVNAQGDYFCGVALNRPIHLMAELDLSAGKTTNNVWLYTQGRLATLGNSGSPTRANKLTWGSTPGNGGASAIYVGNARNGGGFAGDYSHSGIQEVRLATHSTSAGLRGAAYAKERACALTAAGYL